MSSAITTIIDGPQHAVVQVTTSASGDVSDEAILTASALSKVNGNAPNNLRIEELWFSGSIFCLLEWDASTDDPAIQFGVNAAVPAVGYLDFREFGGLKDPRSSGATGIIQLTTTGGAAGRQMTFILKVRKLYASV